LGISKKKHPKIKRLQQMFAAEITIVPFLVGSGHLTGVKDQ
jgi:hypothetical protein